MDTTAKQIIREIVSAGGRGALKRLAEAGGISSAHLTNVLAEPESRAKLSAGALRAIWEATDQAFDLVEGAHELGADGEELAALITAASKASQRRRRLRVKRSRLVSEP